MSAIKQAYIMGACKAFIDTGRLRPMSMEKVAQAAEIASQASPDEVALVGEQITPQDISSLAKILGVLTELQQMFLAQGGGAMDPAMMQGGMPMDPAMMQGGAPMAPPGMAPPGMAPPGMAPPGMAPPGMAPPMM